MTALRAAIKPGRDRAVLVARCGGSAAHLAPRCGALVNQCRAELRPSAIGSAVKNAPRKRPRVALGTEPRRAAALRAFSYLDESPSAAAVHRLLFPRAHGPPNMAGKAADAKLLPQCAAAFVVNLATLANGYCLGWPAVELPVLESNGTALRPSPLESPLSKDEASWVAAAMILASSFTPPLYSAVSARWGRKLAGYLSAAPFALGGVLLVQGRTLGWLVAGRLLAGVGSGGVLALAPHYVAEVAQERHRGALGTVFAIQLNMGILLAYLVGAVATYRSVCALCIALPTAFVAAWTALPETPQYLLSRGRDVDALRSLRWLRGSGYDVEGELERLKKSAASSSRDEDTGRAQEKPSLADFFLDRASRRAFITVLVLIANLQLCGNFIVMNYAVELFSEAGSSLAASALTSQLVDRAGRRPLLLASNAAVAGCLAALGGYFYAKRLGLDVSPVWWLPVASLSLFVAACNLGIAALVFVILNEMFAPDMAHIAISIGIPTFLLAAFAVLKAYVYMLAWLDIYGSYWLFAACTLASNVYIFFFLPETKGRPIADIVAELNGGAKKSARHEMYDPVAQSEKA
ncbi:facilitated trehalose transporter Tret1-like [Schistocerca americana]|uniref:facilitated trehalose transporter Tret1-like n=1 Tax=Schistocerca americana TaxID=7009 RepID=UPI001F5016A3|nr:facilitated trehalose transporter Tret1-like [Schistocerca americana]